MTGLNNSLPEYGDAGFSAYLRRAFIASLGYGEEALERPVVGIANTASDFNACHSGVPAMVEAVKRGVLMAGGLPLAFPTLSIHETTSTPTSMILRNLMAMETETQVASQPMDSVVLIGGCDKTVPAQLMAAASFDIPSVQLVVGAMTPGSHRGETLGACTDCRRSWGRFRAGEIDEQELGEIRQQLAPTQGTCMVMGTASTMACLSETLGVSRPGSASLPATSAARLRDAEAAGAWAARAAVAEPEERERHTVRGTLSEGSMRNAMVVLQALGGSTNAVVHLAALARRLGFSFSLKDLADVARDVPVLVDLKPSGRFYMDAFDRAGGVPALLHRLREHLDLDARTVFGTTLGEQLDGAAGQPGGGLPWIDASVVRETSDPVSPRGAITSLFGSLAPNGAVIKQSAALDELRQHRGRAVVFDGLEDLAARLDDPDLDVNADDVLVLRNAGPRGAPGMPEAGSFPIPRKLARDGVRDMVRISDARMSGSSYGTIVLHVAPESAVGGPLALVRDGDTVNLDIDAGVLDLEVSPSELERRREGWQAPVSTARTQWERLYVQTVLQADQGCDLDL